MTDNNQSERDEDKALAILTQMEGREPSPQREEYFRAGFKSGRASCPCRSQPESTQDAMEVAPDCQTYEVECETLGRLCEQLGIDCSNCYDKEDLIKLVKNEFSSAREQAIEECLKIVWEKRNCFGVDIVERIRALKKGKPNG